LAIEPQVFLCYGRPDKDVAYALAYEFWKNQIECYNYLAKPVEDRLDKELDHRPYVVASRLFIAVLSPEANKRYLVLEEALVASRTAVDSDGLFCSCRAYILATNDAPVDRSAFPQPDLLFPSDRLTDLQGIVSEMISHMGPAFVEHSQKAWKINKELYPEAWANLDLMYSEPPPPLPGILPQGQNSVFSVDHEPTVEELKALGRERLYRLRLDVAKRLDNQGRIYGPTYRPGRQAFLDWNLKRDLEMIDEALEKLKKEERGY